MLHELPEIINKAKFNCSGSISLSDADNFGQNPGDQRQVHLSSADREHQSSGRVELGIFLQKNCNLFVYKGAQK